MQDRDDGLTALVRSVVEPMGYELVGVRQIQGGAGGLTLRVYIDRPAASQSGADGGVNLDDCAAVSHQLSGVLDVEDPIPGSYDLEVSSPGLDRPLFTPEHFERFRGQRVHVKLASKLDGQRNFEGVSLGTEGDAVIIELDDGRHELPFAMIDSARLVYN